MLQKPYDEFPLSQFSFSCFCAENFLPIFIRISKHRVYRKICNFQLVSDLPSVRENLTACNAQNFYMVERNKNLLEKLRSKDYMLYIIFLKNQSLHEDIIHKGCASLLKTRHTDGSGKRENTAKRLRLCTNC